MAKSIEELREDLRLLKEDMYSSAETMDLRILASFVDRMVSSLDELCERVESAEISVEELSDSEGCCCAEPASRPKPKAKSAPKKKSKGAKKRRR
jgi:hypothetical protein